MKYLLILFVLVSCVNVEELRPIIEKKKEEFVNSQNFFKVYCRERSVSFSQFELECTGYEGALYPTRVKFICDQTGCSVL